MQLLRSMPCEAPSSPRTLKHESNGTAQKRKRADTVTPATSLSVQSTTEVRRSPRKAIKLERRDDENESEEDHDKATVAVGGASKRIRKARRQPSKKIRSEDGTVHIEPPANWEQLYDLTSQMRKRILAPVDTMGCESLAEKHRSPIDQRLQTLIALMLSSQTKDTVTAVAMKNLQEGLPGGFNLEALLEISPENLNSMINKVGFHNNKTKFIKQVALLLKEKFNSDIPDTIEGLVSLPGIGPKMAYLTMSAAWGKDEGIGVDVHVHRITNLWGWHKTNNPEQTRIELESWLPREKWHEINHLLVGLGQTVCLPVGRRCGECELGARGVCPGAVAGSPKKRKVKEELEVGVEGEEIVVKKEEETVVEADDQATVVKIKSEDLGEAEVEVGLQGGRIPDIEDIGSIR
ncbi:Endonuclease III like [Cercospora zeina]